MARGGFYVWPNSAGEVSVSSTSELDNIQSSGAHEIVVQGLDENWDLVEEIVELQGTTPVTGEIRFIRVFRCYVLTTGGDSTNVGEIQIKQSDNTLAIILPGKGQTTQAMYSVPRGKEILLSRVGTSTGEGKSAIVRLYVRNNKLSGTPAARLNGTVDVFENQVVVDLPNPIVIHEMTDVWLTAQSSASGTPVSGSFNFSFHNVR